MPSCAAQGCCARSDKGEVLKIFPRKDLQRRQIWIDRVNRSDWTPTKYSALCERHFDRDQWELPREDGKRKLKNTAVPSIFCVEHPPTNDLIAKDHAYCILGYKQVYGSDNDKKHVSDILPIEHIKVEVDENENIEEDVEEMDVETDHEEEEESNVDNEDVEDVENIQCTPDIFAFDEQAEPDPIEMVDCDENDVNAYMSDPSNDPLAISSQDVEFADQVVPHFSHSTKFLFVTKDTRLVSNLPSVVPGEPVVSTLPKLKLLSPKRLLISKSTILTSPPKHNGKTVILTKVGSSSPKLTPISKSLQFAIPIQSSPPKLTPISKSLQSNNTILSSPPKLFPISKQLQFATPIQSSPKLAKISQLNNFTGPIQYCFEKPTPVSKPLHFSPSKLRLMSFNGSSSPLKVRMLSRPLGIKNLFGKIKNEIGVKLKKSTAKKSVPKNIISNKIVSRPILQKAPEYLHAPNGANIHELKEKGGTSNHSQGSSNFAQKNHSVPIDKKDKVKGRIQVDQNTVQSINECAKLENIYFEHQYASKLPWRPPTMSGIKIEVNSVSPQSNSVCKVLGNNHVKMWINQRDRSNETKPSLNTSKTIGSINPELMEKLKSITSTKPSSVIVLNPFKKSETLEPVYLSENITPQYHNLDLFKCPVCKLSFLSSSSLRIHRLQHVSCMTASRHSSEKRRKGKNANIMKKPKSSDRTKSDRRNKSSKSKLNKSYNKLSKNQRFGNSVMLSSRANILKKAKDDEFIRLTNLVSNDHGDEFATFHKNKTLIKNESFNTKHSCSENEVSGSDEENIPSKNYQDHKPKGSVIDESGRRYSLRKKSKVLKPKLLLTTKNKNRPITKPTQPIPRKQPIVLLSKINFNLVNQSKAKKSVVENSTEIDNGWKGWEESDYSKANQLFCDFLKTSCGQSKITTSKNTTSKKNSDENGRSAAESPQREQRSTTHKKNLKELNAILSRNPTQTKGSPKTSKIIVDSKVVKSNMVLPTKAGYECILCNKKFDKSYQLRRHVSCEHQVERQFKCPRRDCSRKFESKRDLVKHLRSHIKYV